MFAKRDVTTMIPAQDLARAKRWYTEKLGLTPSTDHGEMGASYQVGGTSLFLYQTQFAGTAQHTLISFGSTDLLADMATMRARGVTFLDYDMPGLKTVDGVADFGDLKNAWCKDSEGNILGFVQGSM